MGHGYQSEERPSPSPDSIGQTSVDSGAERPRPLGLLDFHHLVTLNSEAGRLLLGLQHNWSVPYAEPNQPTAPLIKSLEFYHQIMNGLDTKIFVQHARALVVGRLGHLYEIAVEPGQHGAPYTIQHLVDVEPNVKFPICIHSGRIGDAVPLGDTIGGVLLSMVNDIEACQDIGSLHELLDNDAPFGFSRRNIPVDWLMHWVSETWRLNTVTSFETFGGTGSDEMPNTNGDPGAGCMNCSYEIATLAVVQDTLNGGTRAITQGLTEMGPSPLTMWLQPGEQRFPTMYPAFPGPSSTANFSVVFTRGISAVDTIT